MIYTVELGMRKILEEYLWNSIQCTRLVQRSEEKTKGKLCCRMQRNTFYVPKPDVG